MPTSPAPRRVWRKLALVVGLAGLPLPALAAPTTPARPYPKGINCIVLPNMRSQSYTVIDDRHLVIEAAGKKYYLLTLFTRCPSLETTLELGLVRHGGELCAPGDAILSAGERCPIQYLEQVESEPAAEALVGARKAAQKAAHKPPGH